MRLILFFVLLLIGHLAQAQECILTLSSGGGITGAATVYKIDETGKVSKGQGLGDIKFNEQSQLEKSVARSYYRKAKKALGVSPAFVHPGNMYFSLATEENGKQLKATWGDAQFKDPESPKKIYRDIMRILDGLTFTAQTPK